MSKQQLLKAFEPRADFHKISALLDQDPGLLSEDLGKGCNALHLACRSQDSRVVRYVLQLAITQGIYQQLASHKDTQDKTPIHDAAQYCCFADLEQLVLALPVNHDQDNPSGDQSADLPHSEVAEGSQITSNNTLPDRIDILMMSDHLQRTPLHLAARHRSSQSVAFICEQFLSEQFGSNLIDIIFTQTTEEILDPAVRFLQTQGLSDLNVLMLASIGRSSTNLSTLINYINAHIEGQPDEPENGDETVVLIEHWLQRATYGFTLLHFMLIYNTIDIIQDIVHGLLKVVPAFLDCAINVPSIPAQGLLPFDLALAYQADPKLPTLLAPIKALQQKEANKKLPVTPSTDNMLAGNPSPVKRVHPRAGQNGRHRISALTFTEFMCTEVINPHNTGPAKIKRHNLAIIYGNATGYQGMRTWQPRYFFSLQLWPQIIALLITESESMLQTVISTYSKTDIRDHSGEASDTYLIGLLDEELILARLLELYNDPKYQSKQSWIMHCISSITLAIEPDCILRYEADDDSKHRNPGKTALRYFEYLLMSASKDQIYHYLHQYNQQHGNISKIQNANCFPTEFGTSTYELARSIWLQRNLADWFNQLITGKIRHNITAPAIAETASKLTKTNTNHPIVKQLSLALKGRNYTQVDFLLSTKAILILQHYTLKDLLTDLCTYPDNDILRLGWDFIQYQLQQDVQSSQQNEQLSREKPIDILFPGLCQLAADATLEIIQCFLDVFKVTINDFRKCTNEYGRNILHYAILNTHDVFVYILTYCGRHIELLQLPDRDGNTPIHYASRQATANNLALALSHLYDSEHHHLKQYRMTSDSETDHGGTSDSDTAIEKGKTVSYRFLLTNTKGFTPLRLALLHGPIESVELLLACACHIRKYATLTAEQTSETSTAEDDLALDSSPENADSIATQNLGRTSSDENSNALCFPQKGISASIATSSAANSRSNSTSSLFSNDIVTTTEPLLMQECKNPGVQTPLLALLAKRGVSAEGFAMTVSALTENKQAINIIKHQLHTPIIVGNRSGYPSRALFNAIRHNNAAAVEAFIPYFKATETMLFSTFHGSNAVDLCAQVGAVDALRIILKQLDNPTARQRLFTEFRSAQPDEKECFTSFHRMIHFADETTLIEFLYFIGPIDIRELINRYDTQQLNLCDDRSREADFADTVLRKNTLGKFCRSFEDLITKNPNLNRKKYLQILQSINCFHKIHLYLLPKSLFASFKSQEIEHFANLLIEFKQAIDGAEEKIYKNGSISPLATQQTKAIIQKLQELSTNAEKAADPKVLDTGYIQSIERLQTVNPSYLLRSFKQYLHLLKTEAYSSADTHSAKLANKLWQRLGTPDLPDKHYQPPDTPQKRSQQGHASACGTPLAHSTQASGKPARERLVQAVRW